MADPKPRRTYSQEEVNAILSRAIERQSTSDLTHEELEAAAQEVGVSAEALEQAAQEVTAQRVESQEIEEIRKAKWQRFYRHARVYLLVNVAFALFGLVTHGELFRFVPMAAGWGLGLFFHFLGTSLADPARERERRARQRQRLAEHEARKQEKVRIKEERKNRAKHYEAQVDKFGHAVSRGVATILEVAADAINETVDARNRDPRRRGSSPDLQSPAPPPPRAKASGGSPPIVTPPPAPGVRVGRDAKGVRVGETPQVLDAEWEEDPASARARRR